MESEGKMGHSSLSFDSSREKKESFKRFYMTIVLQLFALDVVEILLQIVLFVKLENYLCILEI